MSSEPPGEWRDGTLNEFVALQRGHDLPERRRRPGSVPVVGSAGVSGWHDEAKARGPGIVIGRAGASMGVVTYCPVDYWPLNTALFVTDFFENDPRFADHLLRTIDFQGFNSGSVQPMLNRNFIAGIRLSIPPSDEQARIASVLGGLDDKIASNVGLATTIEEVVLREFQGRFVDFVGTELLDDIPAGWEQRSLGQIAFVHRELTTGASTDPYIGLDAMPRGSTVLRDWIEDKAPTGQAARFESGDLLFGKLRPYFKKVGVAPISGRCSTEILVIRPKDEDYYGIVLGHLASDRFIEHCVAVSRGTRMPRSEWGDAATYQIAVPPKAIAREFSDLARAAYAKIGALVLEARILRELLTELRPKLISGEIRVPPDADEEEPGQLVAA
jgi:type I restriction enzyme S subunit